MARRSGNRLNLFLALAIAVLAVLASLSWLVYRYPWPIFLTDFSLARESSFVTHWPMPAIEEERQERKKLKRFPRSEQQRRLGLIMRRMDYLSVPLFDLFLDPGVQYVAPELPAGMNTAPTLIWPSFNTKRKMGSEDTSFRDIRYVVIPSSSGAQCVEGIGMTAGEELRVNLPVAKNKRNVVFTVLPLVPSNLRAWLGQYSWARQFTDADVNRSHSISIPVNDPAANILRLTLGTGNLLLTSASIAQWDRSGRLPIQVGLQSQLWRSLEKAPDQILDTQTQASEQMSEDVVAEENQAVTPATTNSSTEAAQNQQPPSTLPPPGNSSSVVVSENKAGKSAENSKGKDSKGKDSKSMDDLLDPASVKFNQVLGVSGAKSVALGYNVLLVQADPLLNSIASDEKLFAALAPNLSAFMNTALTMPVKLPQFKKGSELFQHTIVRQYSDYIPVELPILTKDLLAGDSVFNLYQEFRNFGYKTVSFAPPNALSYPDVLARGFEVPKVDGRWLDVNDWKFVARRKELDQQNEPATGLEAIFTNERRKTAASLNENDLQKLSVLLEGLERKDDAIPDWRANEISVVSNQSHYLPRLLDSFQRWTKDNGQIRFFGHLYMQNDDYTLRPSLKDFLQVLKVKKLNAFAFPGTTERYARIVMLDRVFGSMVDTLVARRIFHRTVVAVLFPSAAKDKAGEATGRFMLAVPGLTGKRAGSSKAHSMDDLLSTMAHVVGVQINTQDSLGRKIFRGENLDVDKVSAGAHSSESSGQVIPAHQHAQAKEGKKEDSKITSKTNENTPVEGFVNSQTPDQASKPQQVSRYRMIVLPRAAGCQPFEWITASPYFGLTSSQPIVEEPMPRGRVIRVFPCGLRDQVIELSWYQNHEGPVETGAASLTAAQWLGGSLNLGEGGDRSVPAGHDAPFFMVGPQALSLDSLPMRLEMFLPTEVPQIFDVDMKKGVGRETLARLLNLNTQMQNSQMSARTLVYFFREPVRR